YGYACDIHRRPALLSTSPQTWRSKESARVGVGLLPRRRWKADSELRRNRPRRKPARLQSCGTRQETSGSGKRSKGPLEKRNRRKDDSRVAASTRWHESLIRPAPHYRSNSPAQISSVTAPGRELRVVYAVAFIRSLD